LNQVISYDYATGDLLENKNTYFYTQFQGKEFLSAWRKQRDSVLQDKIFSTNIEKKSITCPTEQLLESLNQQLLNDLNNNPSTLKTLDCLLQRFEVTKRLHGEYNSKWRPVDIANYHSMECYLRFSEVLVCAYGLTHSLKYLNSLLKCMDILTALHEKLDTSQKNRLQKVLVEERNAIDQLNLKIRI
jgi:hypothetical protein